MSNAQSLASRLETLVRELALPIGRRVGKPGHAIAEGWVLDQFSRIGLMPYAETGFALPYTIEGKKFTNLVALIPGRDQSLPPLLIGAHYDSVIDAPCADDNAASVALTLEIAAQIRPGDLKHDLVVAIFDAEEPPYFLTDAMGSIHFYEHQTDRRGFHAAIISDLIGHDVCFRSLGEHTPAELRRLVCVLGAESHPALPALIDATPTPPDLTAIAIRNSYAPDLSDHHIFRINQHPYLFLSCGHWEHYHQPSDTPEKLNYTKLAAITTWTAELIRKLDSIPLPATPLVADRTATFEANSIARALPSEIFTKLDIPKPRTRADVDAFVGRMLLETFELS